ncbi:hypothetical protein BUALT_BualtUnG0058500 [Buddleja alternifolia]|uniref:At1g61320/AtMIF1 LRR domain-containing protein n=1 Tax=Buddleja alternifolia TaxID=168488 RepID=A0AAV6W0F5_9LAMI|nr:hypothetical protein BUALT_BualtUnG0058500 [Buddleja alternifolia]
MIYSRNVALSLVALSGIAILATMSTRALFHEKKKKKPSSSKTKTDFMSELIDDLSTKEVGKTSILSKRWRNLYKFASHVNFDCLHIFGVAHHDNCCRRLQEKFIKGVDKFLRIYSGSGMISCQLTCCFTESFPNKLEEWVRSLGRFGVEKLTLKFKCPPLTYSTVYEKTPDFSCQLISEAPSLQFLSLDRCTLQPNLKSQCNSLKSLHLAHVTITSVAMDCILANCLNLQSLVMELCSLSSKLCIHGRNLKDLSIIRCSNTEEIKFYGNNLTRFEYFGSRMGQFYFNHVPQLEKFSIGLRGEDLMHFLFGELARILPWLKSSMFKTSQENQREMLIPTVINMFSNLRRLDLDCFILPEELSVLPILELCPLLQELNFVMSHASPQKKAGARAFDEQQVKKRSVKFHTELKKVGFSGFSGATSETEFALYILRSAIALEEMNISCYYKYYLGNCLWRKLRLPWKEDKLERMHQLFQGHAISKRAKISFSHQKL